MRFQVPLEFQADTVGQADEILGRLENRLGVSGQPVTIAEMPPFPRFDVRRDELRVEKRYWDRAHAVEDE